MKYVPSTKRTTKAAPPSRQTRSNIERARRTGASTVIRGGFAQARLRSRTDTRAGKPNQRGARRTVVIAEVINPGERGGVVDRVSADDAVTTLYTAHYRSLVRLSAPLLGDATVAEEVVQDAFVAMHGKWGRLREPEKAAAYLRQAVVNRSRSALRRRGVEERHLQVSNETGPSAEHSAIHTLERDAVMAALRSLPQRQREVLVLRYYADLSEADIAGALGISQGAVKSHASRGIAALRNVLESAR